MTLASLSVNRLAAAPLGRLVEEAERLGVVVGRGARGVTLIDAGLAAPGQHRGRPPGRRGLHGRAWARSAWWPTAAWAGPPGCRCAARSRCWPAWPASTRAGVSRRARRRPAAALLRARLRPGARAGRQGALFGELGYRDRSDSGVLVLEVDRAPPPVVVDKVLRDCALRRRAWHRAHADRQPRRHHAGRRARARGGAAPGARARLRARTSSRARPARRCRRRRRHACRRWRAPTTRSSTAARCT
jgi:hypothetical protein